MDMKTHIQNIMNTNTRWFSPRIRLGLVVGLMMLGFYGSVFYLVKTFGANRAYAFGRPSLIKMDETAKQFYAEDLKKLLVKDPEKLRMLLGQDIHLVMVKPDLERKDAMMSMWQFRSEACVLDVYFQSAEDWQFAPVMHYEMRERQKALFVNSNSRQSDIEDNKACLRSLMKNITPPLAQDNISDL